VAQPAPKNIKKEVFHLGAKPTSQKCHFWPILARPVMNKWQKLMPSSRQARQKVRKLGPDQQTKKWSVVKTKACVSRRQIAAHGARKLMHNMY